MISNNPYNTDNVSIRPKKKHFIRRVFRHVLALLLGVSLGLSCFVAFAAYHMTYFSIPKVSELDYQSREAMALAQSASFQSVKASLEGHSLNFDTDYPIKKVAKKSAFVENILIVGVDARPGDTFSRADSLMLLSLDLKHQQMKLTSILRDSQFSIENHGRDKVNAAYAYGGIGLLINTINENLDLDIQSFIQLDFFSAIKVADAMGGLTLNISDEELEPTNRVIYEMRELFGNQMQVDDLTQSGIQTVTGVQAISFARLREVGSDFGRTSRQRTVFEAIFKKFFELSPVGQMRTLQTILRELQTNITPSNAVAIFWRLEFSFRGINQYSVPQEGLYYEDGYDLVYLDEQITELHNFIYQ